MSNIFWKNFHLCFTKLKSEHASSILPPSPTKHDETTSSRTLLLKNFNSLYDMSSSASTSKSLMTPSTDADFLSSDSDSDAESPPDFATVFASQRFFFSSPGRSNSIVESTDTRPEAESSTETPTLDGGVAVKKYSPDPYKDFRFSMQEMIEARNLTDVKEDWEFLHELLLCYLILNPKNTHKFIVSAFADIVISLLSSSPDSDSHPRPENHRRHVGCKRTKKLMSPIIEVSRKHGMLMSRGMLL
ncbi:transcription repressor OFP12-like [Herrania umbratica]|uniref:Transcription repressor n=1 Tax=Herrania umbratica TaxID=108875 RepID=A0A6J1AX07_9ROSI|nr:transcription repressor OFP12-like [Herrania umbratica]